MLVPGDGGVGWACSSMCVAVDMPMGVTNVPEQAHCRQMHVGSGSPSQGAVFSQPDPRAQSVVKEGDHQPA